MTASTAMVRVSSLMEEKQRTTFEQFVDHLYEKMSQGITSGGGVFHWSTLPLEEALVSGLWPVLVRMADLLQTSLGTSTQVARVTQPVNRYVSAGLELLFPDLDQAANQFIAEIQSALHGISSREQSLLSRVFLATSARFFGRCVKVTMDELKDLDSARVRLQDLNTSKRQDRRIIFLEKSIAESAQRIVQRFHLKSSTDWSDHSDARYWSGLNIREERVFLEGSIRHIDTLSSFVINPKNLPDDLTTLDDICVSGNWLNTQLLLCAVESSDVYAEHIEQTDVRKAICAIRDTQDAVLVQRFLSRMRLRGSALTGVVKDLITSSVSYTCSRLKQNIQAHPNYVPPALIRVNLSSIQYTHQEAVQALVDPAASLDIAPKMVRQHIRERIASFVELSKLTIQELQGLLRSGKLRVEDLVHELDRLDHSVHLFVVQRYLENVGAEPDVTVLIDLLRRGLLPEDLMLLERIIHRATVNDVELMTSSFLTMLLKHRDRATDRNYVRLFRSLMMQVSIAYTRTLFERTDIRTILCMLIMTMREEFRAQGDQKIDTLSEENRFRVRWITFFDYVCISEIVVSREDVYAHPERSSPAEIEDALIPWLKIPSSAMGKSLIEEYRLSKTSVANLFRDFTEESAFRWRFADEKHLNGRWMRYVQNQQSFIDRFGKKRVSRTTAASKSAKASTSPPKTPRTKKKKV